MSNGDGKLELSKLRWQCRRGVKELDVVLSRYLAVHYAKADAEEQQQFIHLLSLEDPILAALLFSKSTGNSLIQDGLLQKLRAVL